ncbi:MAG: DUF5666 domain-containing protein [Chloroflexi bacterium]|nr:DUF5666 domain-containing protein [Chloroflexota bacterium]
MTPNDRSRPDKGWVLKVLTAAAVILLLTAAQGLPGRTAESSRTSGAPDVRFEGYLMAQGPDKWLVGDYSVIVDQQTTVIEKNGRAEVGAWLAVWANTDGAGGLRAELIYVTRPAGQNGPIVQISGALTKKQNPWWVVHNVPVKITPETLIPEDPQTGWIIWVMAEQHGLDLWALSVAVIAKTPDAVPVEFEGTLEQIEPERWLVSGRWVRISAQTTILGGPPAVGQAVEIAATLASDGSPVAYLARIVPPDEAVTLEALVAAITPDADGGQVWDMIVFPPGQWANPIATLVHVNGNTFVDESRAVARQGQWAEVTALPLGAQEYQADQIRLDQPIPVTVSGDLAPVSGAEGEADGRMAGKDEATSAAGAGRALPKADTAGSWYRLQGRPVWVPQAGPSLAARQYQDGASLEGILLGNGVIWAKQVHALTPGNR